MHSNLTGKNSGWSSAELKSSQRQVGGFPKRSGPLPGNPWRKVAGIGNVLRHDYSISAPIMWKLVREELTALDNACRVGWHGSVLENGWFAPMDPAPIRQLTLGSRL